MATDIELQIISQTTETVLDLISAVVFARCREANDKAGAALLTRQVLINVLGNYMAAIHQRNNDLVFDRLYANHEAFTLELKEWIEEFAKNYKNKKEKMQ